jgi:MFS family permease
MAAARSGKASPETHLEGQSFAAVVVFVALGIFATTFSQPQNLGKLPLQNYLKTRLGATPDQMAAFFFICSLFWYLQPLAGILTDAFPLFKTRRRHYALFSTALAAASWIGLAFVPKTYNWLLVAAVVINLFMVMMATVTGAVLVEIGQTTGSVGRLTAVRQFAYNLANLVQGPLAGWLATGALALTCGLNSFFLVSFLPAVYFILREKPTVSNSAQDFKNAKAQLGTVVRSRTFWWVAVFVTLFYFAPGFTTLLYYRQNDILRFDQQHIGYLASLGGLGGISGAAVYGAIVRRASLKALLVFAIVTAALATFMYLRYDSFPLAVITDFSNGFFFGFAEVAFIDLAGRATPSGCEGLGYSILMSARYFALFGGDYIGSKLSVSFHWSWTSMVLINGLTTGVVIVLLPLIPRALLLSRDRPKAEAA